jgi:hypothetical protein
MLEPELLTRSLRVLLSWESHPSQVPPIRLSQNQVTLCTDFSEHGKNAARFVDTVTIDAIAKQAKVGMIWVAGRSPTLVSHSEAWRSHES